MLCFPKHAKEKPVGYSFNLICGYLIHVHTCSICHGGLKGLLREKRLRFLFTLFLLGLFPSLFQTKLQ